MRASQGWIGLGVIVGIAGAMSSCAPGQVLVTAHTPPTSGPTGFVACDEAVVGSRKDVYQNRDTLLIEVPLPAGQVRRHILTVPANAVPTGKIRFGLVNIGDGYVGVDATANPNRPFDPPVTLRLSYAGCSGADDAGSLQMYRWEQVGSAWRWRPIGGNHNPNEQWVEVNRTDLSEYALGAI